MSSNPPRDRPRDGGAAGQPAGGLAAVLFDMDGTLVDSEKLWDVALHELAARYGGVLSDGARRRMVGTDSEQTMAILHEDLGQPWRDAAAGADWLDTRMVELLAQGLDWLPGASKLLGTVRAAGLPTALVTNTGRMLVEAALGTLGRHNFDAVISADDVLRPKPDPEPYLAAAATLGVDPARCVVIEDSPSGVRSAQAAGCAVLAVPYDADLSGIDSPVRDSLLEVDLGLLYALLH